jgi:hypothetical protein
MKIYNNISINFYFVKLYTVKIRILSRYSSIIIPLPFSAGVSLGRSSWHHRDTTVPDCPQSSITVHQRPSPSITVING